MSYVTISAQLLTLVSAISGVETADDSELSTGDYPIVTVIEDDMTQSVGTTVDNIREYSFMLSVRYLINKDYKNLDTVGQVLRPLVDTIINTIDKEGISGGGLLGGNVETIIVNNVVWGYKDTSAGKERVANIQITCKKNKYLGD